MCNIVTGIAAVSLILAGIAPVALAQSGRFESQPGVNDSIHSDALRRFDKMNLDYFRMNVEPTTPDSGIVSGFVIAYGHYLRPPYNVLAKGTAVFINGVQVRPQLEAPGAIAARQAYKESLLAVPDSVAQYYRRKDSVERAAYPLYADAAAKYGKTQALRITRDFIMKSGVAESTRMEPPSMLLVYNKLTHHSVAITFYTHEELKAVTYDEASKADSMGACAAAEHMASSISQSLTRGHFRLYTGNSWIGAPASDFERIRIIMQDESLPLREKFARLVAGGLPMADWLVANYRQDEWANTRRGR